MSHIYYEPSLENQDHKLKCEKGDPVEIKFLCSALRHKKILRIFQVLFACINIIVFFYCVTGHMMLYHELDDFKNEVVLTIECFTDFSLVVVNVLTVIAFTSSPFTLELVDFITRHSHLLMAECKIFTKVLQTLRLLPLLCLGLEIYFLGGNIGWHIFQYFFPKSIWSYSLNLMICGFVCFIAKIRCYFAALNHRIEDIDRNHSALRRKGVTVYILNKDPKNDEMDNSIQNLIDISNQYTQLCNLLDRFNRYIRSFLILAIVSITVHILYNCTVLIEFGTKPKTLVDVVSRTALMAIQITSIAVSMAQITLCALIGEDLQNEGAKTSAICYSILNKLNRNSKNENDNLLMKELKFLLEQSESRNVCVHAGGFFRLNWGILGSVTSTVATYTIVIIQFLLK